MKNPLSTFRNVPVSTQAVASLYPDIRKPVDKVGRLASCGDLIMLKKGLYVVSPDVSGVELSEELIANHLYTPSYVSMASALRYYGLIPEAVYTMQSMTLNHAKKFDTPLGRFTYTHIGKAAYSIGLVPQTANGVTFIMASPEKALCDMIANSQGVNLRYNTDARRYLEEDIRMEMDDFMKMDVSIFKDYAKVGKKSTSISTLIKLLENGRQNI